jgi:holin-like protein
MPRSTLGRGTLTGRSRALVLRACCLASQFLILWLAFVAGTLVVQLHQLRLPGNLVGMLLLFLLLATGIVRPAQVQEVADFLLRHLAFFFIPLAVGLMTWDSLFATQGIVLGLSLVGSTIVGLASAGLAAEHLSGHGDGPDAP